MKDLVEEIMHEKVVYRGYIASRIEVYKALSHTGHKRADAFAWTYCRAATPKEITELPAFVPHEKTE